MGIFFRCSELKNSCLRTEEQLILSSFILCSIFGIEQEVQSDNKQQSTLTFGNSMFVSMLYMQLQKHKWKTVILWLKTNFELLMLKCFWNEVVCKVLPKNPVSFTSLTTVSSLFLFLSSIPHNFLFTHDMQI